MVTGKRSNQIFSVRVFLFNKNNTEIHVIFFSQKELPVALSQMTAHQNWTLWRCRSTYAVEDTCRRLLLTVVPANKGGLKHNQ